MTRRVRIALAGVLALAVAVAVGIAGHDGGDGNDAGRLAGSELLGPETGEQVGAYLQRSARTLPDPGAGEVWALIQLHEYRTAAGSAAVVDGARASKVVLRVPLPRVQTALIVEGVAGQQPVPEITTAMSRAAQDRTAAAGRTGGRNAAVARAEAAALGTGCACVLAVLVRAERPTLDLLAGRNGVRAVHAAAPGSRLQSLAIAPLLPEQVDVVGPVPDDGQVR